ncbi:MAG: radical SAM protein [Candidatus Nanoarchaeia archaeon]|jgi:radical SAM superfamily enzyme YgiQ (UPF0313 family)|nr:radical SAM protein [Candidatus Nanoarchaeia archaeon]
MNNLKKKILLIVYDNGSYIHNFPLGTAYIAEYLKQHKHQVTIYNQDVFHWEESHLTNYLDNNKFDYVGLGFIAGYYQYKKIQLISKAINASKNRLNFKFILGGHGPSPEPNFFLKKLQADYIVVGEGEVPFLFLVEGRNPSDIDSLVGLDFNNNDKRDNVIKNIDDLRPNWDLFPIENYVLVREFGFKKTARVMSMVSGRGCNFRCNFCYRLDKGLRIRSNESIIDEIKYLKKTYNIDTISFLDELLMSSEKRVILLCEEFLKNNLNIQWECSGRLNYAKKEVLKLMKRAGCVFINYGIESLDDNVLKNMNKCLTVDQIIKGVEATKELDINQGLNIIFGNIGETKEILMKGVEFIKKYGDGCQLRTIRPVTPYPGSPLYYKAINEGLLKDVEDFYENKHLNSDLMSVNFTNLSDNDFYEALKEANIELIKFYYSKNNDEQSVIDQCKNLYDNKDVSFRGFRQM